MSEILHHFSQFTPRSVNDPTGMILTISYREVPHMLPAKYQPIWPSGFREEVVESVARRRTDDGGCLSYTLPWSLRLKGPNNL